MLKLPNRFAFGRSDTELKWLPWSNGLKSTTTATITPTTYILVTLEKTFFFKKRKSTVAHLQYRDPPFICHASNSPAAVFFSFPQPYDLFAPPAALLCLVTRRKKKEGKRSGRSSSHKRLGSISYLGYPIDLPCLLQSMRA